MDAEDKRAEGDEPSVPLLLSPLLLPLLLLIMLLFVELTMLVAMLAPNPYSSMVSIAVTGIFVASALAASSYTTPRAGHQRQVESSR